jgi:hypothetical protein
MKNREGCLKKRQRASGDEKHATSSLLLSVSCSTASDALALLSQAGSTTLTGALDMGKLTGGIRNGEDKPCSWRDEPPSGR